jgi:exopolyphosphatase/pppGpp-phosphohydrolase
MHSWRRMSATARAHRADVVEVVVTAPGRQPENGAELVEAIERTLQRRIRSLSADEEACLAFAGAVRSAALSAPVMAVVDLGGASTEIAVGRPESGPHWARSVDLGALRLTTRFLQHAPPQPSELDAARAAIADAFAGTTPPLPAAALVVGGSARALGRVCGETLRRAELATAASILVQCDPMEIADRFAVGKGRARQLLAASLILGEVQRRLVVPLRVSAGGVREGVLLAEAAAA